MASCRIRSATLFVGCLLASCVVAQEANVISRCEVVPLPRHEVSMQVDGVERVRWHYGEEYERPFFFPLNGPSGSSLTRMGHPGAENHDHHQSVWFAHHDIEGQSYWANSSAARIRQKHWYRYVDGNEQSIMAVRLGWYNDRGTEVMDSDVVAALRPRVGSETILEIQLTCRVPQGRDSVEIGKTNFGFFAVRVAKSVSDYFGNGTISNSEGLVGEPAIFGKQARWMDYSGAVPVGKGRERRSSIEGITYFDHPDNPRYPTYWHVRQDGWMGASFGMHEGLTLTPDQPLTLRYLLHLHAGRYDHQRAEKVASEFGKLGPFEVTKASKPHRQYEVSRRPK